MLQNDYLQRFTFKNHAVRGEFVLLHEAFTTVTQQRPYPEPIQQLLGQAMAATALLSATIKYSGSLILQAQTAGVINLLVAQSNDQLELRALAKWLNDSNVTSNLLGEGHLVITISPNNSTENYQGVVPINAEPLNKLLEIYFEKSEQLPTRLWLAANGEFAAGLLLQKMPSTQIGERAAGDEWNYWEHIETLASTITDQELLSLNTTTILHRLFHEEDVVLYDQQPVTFRCSCNQEKMSRALKTMGEADVRAILSTQKFVAVTCEFCNNSYEFNKAEIDAVFVENNP